MIKPHRLLLRACVTTLLCVCALASSTAGAATYYIDAAAPDGGDGSINSPFNQIEDFAKLADENDHVFLRGRFAEPVTIYHTDYLTFEPWPGEEHWINCAAIDIEAFGEPDGNAYPKIGEAFFPASVAEGWTLADERPKGHLDHVSSLEDCKATPGSWFVNLTTQQVWVHTSDSSDPRINGRSYQAFLQGDGFLAVQCDNLTLRGAIIAGWCLDSNLGSIDASGIFLRTTNNSLIEDCIVIDSAGHSIEFSGTMCRGNVVRNCEMRGLRVDGANHLVFFSSEDGGEVEGCLVENVTAHCYSLLDPAGEPLTDASTTGFFQHCGGATLVTDIEYRNCSAIGYEGHRSSPWDGASQTALVPEVDRLDWNAYPIRLADCDFVQCTNIRLGGHTSAAFARCSMSFVGTGEQGGSVIAAIDHGPSFGGVHRLLLESCELSSLLAPAAGSVFAIREGIDLSLTNVTIFIASGVSPAHVRFLDDDASIHAQQTVFSSIPSAILVKGPIEDVSNAGGLEIDYCWYHAIPEGSFSQAAAMNTSAEWQALVDTGQPGVSAIYGVDPGFEDPPEDLRPLPGAALRAIRFEAPGPQPNGLLGNSYMGSFGSRQLPPTADLTGDGRISAIDLAILLGAWGPCDSCPEDLTNDGAVTALDIATLLSFWTG